MTSGIAVYEHPDFGSVRMFEEGGEVYAVADDFAKALGYREAWNLIRSLEPDEFTPHIVRGKRGDHEVNCITEAGMYHAILMRKAACVKDPDMRGRVEGFQRWVTHEVIPAIRRTGGYVNPLAPQMGDEEGRALLSRAVIYAQQSIARLEAENDAMRPMAALGEAVSASRDCIDVGALSRILRQNGCDWGGRNRTYGHLRDEGYLMSQSGSFNLPYQRWVEAGLFEVREVPYRTPDGTTRVALKTMVTQRGVEHLLRRYAPDMTLPGLESESESEGEE